MGAAAEAKQEVVGSGGRGCRRGLEAGLEGGEVDGAVMLVNLDGVAAAEGDVGAACAGEVGEDALAADLAIGARRAGGDLGAALPLGRVQRSKESRVRRMRWGWPVRSLRASVTWMEAARLTAVERMPAVSQVSALPEGGLGKMQARQAVGDLQGWRLAVARLRADEGRIFMVAA